MSRKQTVINDNTIDIIQYDRKQLRIKITSAKKRKNTKAKFDDLIKLTTQYCDLTETLKKYGKNTEIQAEWLTPEYWKHLKDSYKGKFEEPNKSKPSKKSVQIPVENKQKSYWRITLSWSTPPENSGCSTPVENIKSYMDRMSKWVQIKMVDTSNMRFSDRYELSHTYELECDKKQYINILESAKYILEISSATDRDICNIGISGKKFEK